MIRVYEELDRPQSYTWGNLHPGDVIKDTAWTAENDYALVVSRQEEVITIYRFEIGAAQSLRSTDCAGHSFYKYNADFIVVERV